MIPDMFRSKFGSSMAWHVPWYIVMAARAGGMPRKNYCPVCGQKLHDGCAIRYWPSGFYQGLYSCADEAPTVQQVKRIKHLLRSCCQTTRMPGVLNIFWIHPELSSVIARFLMYGKLEIACSFRRFLLPISNWDPIPSRISDTILEFLLPIWSQRKRTTTWGRAATLTEKSRLCDY